ncbi:DEAD/DEAH box helicase family protein [Streptomyces cellulosae]|jgi:type I restriction enzyme R subunit|uniref:DEAD/DEAH box helicase family protein n=2 Tax=Streptomyces TaxID=1883 RepID=A0ABU3JE47_9ACTN|nr:DEAD/DEAH box helicase family protein [Streptomyces sp. McG7]MDQ0489094.1 type I restriction enzyme R subunit [Streptomyces thermodiastaticus]MDT6972036.1 DEAD/DEAH box helicase family protein [Streptomyces thermocarboxydus]THC56910.1 restriction endonuclease [Streptomyces sp. Akac8]WSB43058.1 DEAD/DEAH box helicase family protein [Streptomyces cellulosae]
MDEQLRRLHELAKASPNFGMLYGHEPLLALYGSQSELNVFTNPNAASVSARQFGEVLAEELVRRTGLRVTGTRQIDRLRALTSIGALTAPVREAFDTLRRSGNEAVHAHVFDTTAALANVRLCWDLGVFFDRALTGSRTVRAFVPPAIPDDLSDPAEARALREALDRHRATLAESRVRLSETENRLEAERRAREEAQALMTSAQQSQAALAEQLQQLQSQIAELRKAQQADYEKERRQPRKVAVSARQAIVERAQRPAPLNEVQARVRIDALLEAAGWVVQDRDQLNPLAGRGVAVREFTLATGRADYVLYVDQRIVGVIEAKREGTPLSSALSQNERYARGVHRDYALSVWRRDEPFAFRYATTGTETYFVNRLDPDARSRAVFAFHRPETIAEWMRRAENVEAEGATFRAALRERMPELERHGLRDAQFEAINKLEASLAQDHPRALIQMATGAGKTFTAVTATHRLLRHAGAGRVLFLVDRNNLGRQALGEFRRYKTPDEGRTFTDLYNVDRLGSAGIQRTSAVVVCTIQKMYSLLKGEPLMDDDATADAQDEQADKDRDKAYALDHPASVEYQPSVPIESFDVIIVDECHRSIYGLWRAVLEYFDAHLVGLTATPTPQTRGFFDNNLVSEYTFEQAVADGVNVDFDIARIHTNLRDDGGATIEAGTTVRIRDRKTRAQRYEELENDFEYSIRELGRSVINEDEIRQVLTLYKNTWPRWFPGRAEVPKTLIFAVGEDHAEEVLKQVKEVFGRGDEFAKKITYKSRQNGENPDELISALRNSPSLRVAITVDMIATGTDVKALECVIFLRSVRSPVLFEQMKGRGARSIDPDELRAVTPKAARDLAKDRFVLVDAVGVTDSPLVDARPLIPAGERQVSLNKLLDKTATLALTTDEAETLARRLARVDRQLTDDERRRIDEVAGDGTTLTSLARNLADAVDVDSQDAALRSGGEQAARKLVTDAIAPLTGNPELRKLIVEIRHQQDLTYDETTAVTVTDVVEVDRAERAREELEDWREVLTKAERDRHAAVQVALGSGSGNRSIAEKRAALRELEGKIKSGPRAWTPTVLWGHYEQLGRAAAHPGREAGLGDLIALIRYELGADDQLQPYRNVVEERFQGWLLRQRQAGVEFTAEQMWWLERIRDVIADDVGIESPELNIEPFTAQGGRGGFAATFGGRTRAQELLGELNRELG